MLYQLPQNIKEVTFSCISFYNQSLRVSQYYFKITDTLKDYRP